MSAYDVFLELKVQANKVEWITGRLEYEKTGDFLEWLMEQLDNNMSFFARNLEFQLQPTSSGELAMAMLFLYMDDALKKSTYEDIVLIIDEVDCYMHPRWQQRIMKDIINRLRSYKDKRFQLIVTSHSPIILSDFCKYDIVKLNKDNYEIMVCPSEFKTFGANIENLYYDSFFMNEGDIGEFSKEQINKVIEWTKNDTDFDSEKEVKFIIDNIGEPFVRNELLHRYEKKMKKKNSILINKINQLDDEKIYNLEKKIDELLSDAEQ